MLYSALRPSVSFSRFGHKMADSYGPTGHVQRSGHAVGWPSDLVEIGGFCITRLNTGYFNRSFWRNGVLSLAENRSWSLLDWQFPQKYVLVTFLYKNRNTFITVRISRSPSFASNSELWDKNDE